MRLQHGSSVLVTDGQKALFLRNEGDCEFPDLRLIYKWESHVPSDRDLKSDAPGRVFSSLGGSTRRSAYLEPDLHALTEARFVEDVADYVSEHLSNEACGSLVIVAPPRTLGIVHKHLHPDIAERILAEVPKDLVKHPLAEIEELFAARSEEI